MTDHRAKAVALLGHVTIDTDRIADALERIAAALERIAAALERIAAALERIASALERAYPLDLRDSGLTRAWDDAEIARDPNRCEPGCIRPSLHGGDCDVPAMSEAENRAGD